MKEKRMPTYFSPFNADDSVERAGWVVEEGDVDGWRWGRDPRPLRLGINVKYVRLARKDGLLPIKNK